MNDDEPIYGDLETRAGNNNDSNYCSKEWCGGLFMFLCIIINDNFELSRPSHVIIGCGGGGVGGGVRKERVRRTSGYALAGLLGCFYASDSVNAILSILVSLQEIGV